jgi:hypothetical protein
MRLCDINRIAVDSLIMFWNVWVENGSVSSHGVLEPRASIIIRQSFDHRVEVDTFLGTGARGMILAPNSNPPQPTSFVEATRSKRWFRGNVDVPDENDR